MSDKPLFENIRLVAFDLDGTLIDAFADITRAANYILRQNNMREMSLEEVKKHVGRGARVLVSGILDTTDEEVIDRNYALLVEQYKNSTDTHATFYDGALPAVENLRMRGIKTAVISNKPDEVAQKVMVIMGAADRFDYIYGESPRFPRKPSPASLIHVMDEAGVTADQTLMVGDTSVDIETARNAGVRAVVVTYGQMTEAELSGHNPDAMISSMAELNALVG